MKKIQSILIVLMALLVISCSDDDDSPVSRPMLDGQIKYVVEPKDPVDGFYTATFKMNKVVTALIQESDTLKLNANKVMVSVIYDSFNIYEIEQSIDADPQHIYEISFSQELTDKADEDNLVGGGEVNRLMSIHVSSLETLGSLVTRPTIALNQ